MTLGFNEADLLNFKLRNTDATILISNENKSPEIMGKEWEQTKPQTPEQINDLIALAKRKNAFGYGILNGPNDYWGLDFEWSWVYRIWMDKLGSRAETYTVQTANGGKRPVFKTKEVKKDWGEPFKNTLNVEIKGKGYVVLGGKATDILGKPSEYKVFKDLPVKRDDKIIKDTLDVLTKIYAKAQFLGYKCIHANLDKKLRLEHEQRLILLDFMLLEEWPDDAIHNFFMDVHEREGKCDYKKSKTQTQIKSGRSYVAKGGLPKSCTAKDGKTALYQIFSFDKTQCDGCLRRSQLTNPTRFFYQKDFVPMKLSEEIQREFSFFATSPRSDLWIYTDKGIWEPKGEIKVAEVTKDKLQWLWKNHYKNETENHIRACNYIDAEKIGGPLNKIVMENGVYDLETNTLSDFDPKLYATSRIPVTYNPDAKCPKIDQFLSEVLHPEDIPKFYEITGYCLYRSYPIARIVIFYGEEGSNGKSTALKLITGFLGKENVSSVNIQALKEDGFRAAQIFSKLANISGDLPNAPITDTSLLKKCTGGDLITAERKFHDPFDFYNYAKLYFSANEVPNAKYDDSGAYFRRMLLVEFPNSFPDGEPGTDSNILEKITTPDELSGFFNKAINGLKTLLERGKFEGEKTTEERTLEYMRESNTVQYFAKVYCTLNTDPEYYITNERMYDHYVFMCRNLEKIPKASNIFSKELRRWVSYAYPTHTNVNKRDTRVWRGVDVNLTQLETDFNDTIRTDSTDSTVKTPIKDIREYNIDDIENKNSVDSNKTLNRTNRTNRTQTPNEIDLLNKAVNILKLNQGKMRQDHFFDQLDKVGHKRRDIDTILRYKHKNRFEFMGLNVRLKGDDSE